MNNKKLLILLILILTTLVLFSIILKKENADLLCEADTYYKWYVPEPGKTVYRVMNLHLRQIDNTGKGKGRISFTSKIHYGKATYYLRRDVIVDYQVSSNELYFFKPIYINKDIRDSLPPKVEALLLPEIIYKIGSLSSYTIRKAGKQGYFVFLTDTPLFFCNRLQ